VVHLVYTFWGPKLTPRDPTLQSGSLGWASNTATAWGLLLFGLVLGFLALAHRLLLLQSPFLLVVGLAMLGGFVVLSKVYSFSAPPEASASLSAAMWLALCYRGPSNARSQPLPSLHYGLRSAEHAR
jgi:hypothetical protein